MLLLGVVLGIQLQHIFNLQTVIYLRLHVGPGHKYVISIIMHLLIPLLKLRYFL